MSDENKPERSPIRVVKTAADPARQNLPEPVPQSRRILIVDDELASRMMMETLLEGEGYQVSTAENGPEALAKIEDWNPDLVLMDYEMPKMSGLETVRRLRERKNYVATIFISAQDGEDLLADCLKAGADDFLKKPVRFTELLARVQVRFRIKDLHDALEKANGQLQAMTETDYLTGLYNMRVIYDKIGEELRRANRRGAQVGCLMIDLDHFKSVNDQNDHLVGSQFLKEVGWVITNRLRAGDFAARYGGDEFLIVLTDSHVSGIQIFGNRLREAIADHIMVFRGKTVSRTASLGAALAPINGMMNARELVRAADAALYQSKRAGRNRLTLAPAPEESQKVA